MLKKVQHITQKEPAPKDKRAMIVSLTEKGKVLEFKGLDFQEVFSRLDETTQENMKRYLKAISDHLNELLKDEDAASAFPVRELDERRGCTCME